MRDYNSNVVLITWLIWIALRCPREVFRFNDSLTHSLLFTECHFYLRPPLVPMGIVIISCIPMGWVGLWGLLWWAPSAMRKDHHGVSSGWSSVWHRSNTGLSSTQYEQIPIIFGVWPFWVTPFFFRSITFGRAYGWIVFPLLKLLSFFWLTYYCSIGLCLSVRV